MNRDEAKDLVGCCGLYCGLCNKYQSHSPSRCNGCKVGEQHSWCSIWNCCVKRRNFETCAECEDLFNCEIFSRRKVDEWIPAADNLRKIKMGGIQEWLDEQIERQALVETLLVFYNEGRSMSFYCRACARLEVESLKAAIRETNQKLKMENIAEENIKSRARICKTILQEIASGANMDLRHG